MHKSYIYFLNIYKNQKISNLRLKMMKCRTCSNEYDLGSFKPYLIIPCCHMVCGKCLNDDYCSFCSNKIQSNMISQDIIKILEQKKMYRLKQIEEKNKNLESNHKIKKETIQNKINKQNKEINFKSDQIINLVLDQKKELLKSINRVDLLNEIQSDRLFIKNKLNELKNNLNNPGYIDLTGFNQDLMRIENKIKLNLNKLDEVKFNKVFIGTNTKDFIFNELVYENQQVIIIFTPFTV